MGRCVLIIGVRRQCYKAALELGHDVILWSDGELKKARKKNLTGWIEDPYSENLPELSEKLIEQLKKFKIERVIANTEETVTLGALVRKALKLKHLAVDVTDRFHNKWVMKNFALKNDIPITKYKLIENDTKPEVLIEELGLPLVIKPVDSSGARDVKIAKNLDDVKSFLETGLLAEAFVEGSEVSVETFVKNGEAIFHNITEYLHQWRKSVVPAKLEDSLKKKILEINDQVLKSFGIDRGMTHAEFYLTKDGPVFGEIAIRPPGGYYMDLIQKVYNFDSWKLYIDLSCGDEPKDFNPNEKGSAAVFMMHPGAGKILSIKGAEEVKEKIENIFEFSLRREVDDIILPHESTSNEVGHILFWSPNREQLNKDLEYIESTLTIEVGQ